MAGKELLQYINKMISSQKMDMHPYSGSVAESVAFSDEEASVQTPAYKVNIVAFKQINRSVSREFSDFGDMNIDDSMHHQVTKPENKTFKCFKCFGKKASISTSILRNEGHHKCRECEGLEYINQSHPLVAIMDQIIRRKLPHLPIKAQQDRTYQNKRETLQLQYGCRDAIKEESFSYQEDSPPFCRNCNKQCDANAYRTCQKCFDFNICELCFQKKHFSHYHPLVLKDNARLPTSRMLPSPSNIKKNPQLADSQTQQYLEDLELKCSKCGQMIDICYEACLNCEDKNIKYYICNVCSQSHQYNHNMMHQLQVRTISGLSSLNRFQSNDSAHQNLQLNSMTNSIHHDIKRSIVRFNHDLMNDSCEGSHNSQFLFEKDSQGLADEIVFNLSDHMLDQEPAIRHKLSNTCRNQREHSSIRKRGESPSKKDDGSVVSGDLSSSLLILKCPDQQPPSPTVPFVPIFNTITHQSIHPLHKTNPEDEYIFNDYQCDMCSTNPIRNKRYHCKECEDYDLCESCYIIRYKEHQHREFQEIDGFQLINQRNSLFRSIKIKASSELRRTMK